MSAFTPFNGPCGPSGASVEQLTKLIAAYETLSAQLATHIASQQSDRDNIHNFKNYLDTAINNLKEDFANKDQVNSALATKASKADLLGNEDNFNTTIGSIYVSDALTAVNKLNELLAEKADSDAVYTIEQIDQILANKASIDSVNQKADSSQVYTKTESDSKYFEKDTDALINSILKLTADIIRVNDSLIAKKVIVNEYIDFMDWWISPAQFAGTGTPQDTGTSGLYVIAQLSDEWIDVNNSPTKSKFKSARAHVKYVNNHNFDAIVDMTVTIGKDGNDSDTFSGAITALVSKSDDDFWEGLAFHIVRGTDRNGNTRCYLAVSSNDILRDTAGNSANMLFRVCGINVQPFEASHVSTVQLTATTKTYGKSGFSVSALSMDEYTARVATIDKLIKVPVVNVQDTDGNIKQVKLVTEVDLKYAAVPIGGIIEWPLYRTVYATDDHGNSYEVGHPAINYPDGWAACAPDEASEVTEYKKENPKGKAFNNADYPDLAKALNGTETPDPRGKTNLPVRDFSIIKLKYWDGISDDIRQLLTPDYLKRYIDSMVAASSGNEVALTNIITTIQNEIDRSTAKDALHDQSINALDTNKADKTEVTAEVNRLDSKIDTETTRATTAESTLDSKIDTETSRATAAESTLDGKIDDETTRATTAESTLDSKIDTETTRATTVESTLDSKIDTETTLREAYDNAINDSKIDKGYLNPVLTFAGIPTNTNYDVGQRAYDSVGDKRYALTKTITYTIDGQGNPVSSVSSEWTLVGDGPWS